MRQKKFLNFALNTFLHFASMLLHFALVLHVAAILITFCGVTIVAFELCYKPLFHNGYHFNIPLFGFKLVLLASFKNFVSSFANTYGQYCT